MPGFSSSSLRFGPQIIRYRQPDAAAQVKGCSTWGPCSIQPPMPDLGAVVYEDDQIAHVEWTGGYEPLIQEIARFFRTGQPPVSAEETLELFAFMEAADESLRQGGVPITLESVMARAREAASRVED